MLSGFKWWALHVLTAVSRNMERLVPDVDLISQLVTENLWLPLNWGSFVYA
ncbi:hypothetical protein [Pseudobacteroides cellulosolvens]|uniref:hypothetical protein n=1 Tax=Pseudobacteroides cellulosolvens TaxID=35825 RepID=UPI0012B546E9|nr:hypothetical protein [Pseudobacteroides cellulosolvens]